MPSQIIFLTSPHRLARQVAEVILQGKTESSPIELGDTQIWVPTAGAARRIRAELAALTPGRGVLTPEFAQPMQALLPKAANIATRAEREAAWVNVLRAAPPEEWEALLPDPRVLETASGALGVAGLFCDLGDLLAEGGWHPAHPFVASVCADDAGRWEPWQTLQPAYIERFAAHGLSDPNALRLDSLFRPTPADNLRRVIVACIPDLAEAAVKYLDGLSKMGVAVQTLVWNPGALPGGWDAAGRPLVAEWTATPLEISQIAVCREPAEEASVTVDFLAGTPRPGDYAMLLADETLGAHFVSEIQRRGGVAFQPEGRTLAAEEAGRIALEWETWQTGGDLRLLRNLLQLPHFHRWLGGRAGPTQLLAACDHLIMTGLVETLPQARAFLEQEPNEREAEIHAHAKALVATLDAARRVTFSEILETQEGSEAAGRVLEIWQEISTSPLYREWPEGRVPALSRALRAERIFTGAPEGSVELSGWLEAPWIDAERLAIGGCVEGKLPTSINEHPFLPDSKRAALGLQDNARRLARDAYLASCLEARQSAGNLQWSYSRFDAEGSPLLPSRLLLRTTSDELPARVEKLFSMPVRRSRQPDRQTQWRWHLPEALRKAHKPSISPSRCGKYLACPTRYYWSTILHAESCDTDPREMDARTFGSLIHRALEAFGRRAPDESNATRIEKIVLQELASDVLRLFGPSPTAAIRVQLEAAQVRLRAFARVQAEEFAAGWRITDVEKPIAADGSLMIGPLALSAQIDRIEEHPDHGLRIMDYKTSAEPKDPVKIHLGKSQPDHFLAESQVVFGGKERTWTDLQLPLYRFIGEKIYQSSSIQTAYFALPADPSQTRVIPLELDSESYSSALVCAEEIARRIAAGQFWPPQTPRYDDLGALFLNGPPEDCFSAETIAFLKGTP